MNSLLRLDIPKFQNVVLCDKNFVQVSRRMEYEINMFVNINACFEICFLIDSNYTWVTNINHQVSKNHKLLSLILKLEDFVNMHLSPSDDLAVIHQCVNKVRMSRNFKNLIVHVWRDVDHLKFLKIINVECWSYRDDNLSVLLVFVYEEGSFSDYYSHLSKRFK